MRRTNLISLAIVATAAIVVAPTAAPANRGKVTKLRCTIDAFQQGMPNPNAIQFGFVSCPKPLGRGLHYSAFTVTSKPAPGVPGAASGTFRNYYNRGTTTGTFDLVITASSPTNLMYNGTISRIAGTGTFRRIAGRGKIACTSTDGGAHKHCVINTTLTGI